ncbi:hypothetical protein [Thermosulfurimonas sp. F29]|uniref:hypothetical protein n=1 Tax=Thermosulfurimonas sp. F29 TaxID=2867247 RepID=UPI001C834ED6|nr:hypothetical protein [Thermosulfurimonas sp. F29]MBX6423013.1 hypothetical protein [Thermosulfurimonas sp. F29]
MIVRFSGPEPAFSAGLCALWLALVFGGLGARSRRGFGSFRVVPLEGDEAPVSFAKPEGKNLSSFIGQELGKLKNRLKDLYGADSNPPPEIPSFPVLRPEWWNSTLAWPPRSFRKSYPEALDYLGKKWRAFRMGKTTANLKKEELFGSETHTRDYDSLLSRRWFGLGRTRPGEIFLPGTWFT